MKKFFTKFFVMFLIVSLIPVSTTTLAYSNIKSMNVNARAAIAIDKDTGLVLYEKNAYEVIPMASTTKIMTALVAIRHGDLDKKITISKRAAAIRGSTVKYRVGEEITLRELLYGLMFKSGNDAALAIAEGVGGSVEEFIKLMNEEAVNIGLSNTHFETPHGLDKPTHYTTAYDLALLTAEAKKNNIFDEIVKSKTISRGQHKFTRDYNNINKLLYSNPQCTGVKTGYTGQAGKCLVSSFKLNNNEIIVVTLNCTERWKESNKIYDYVKNNYTYDKIRNKNDSVFTFVDLKGKKVNGVIKEEVTLPKDNSSKYEEKIEIYKDNFKDKYIKSNSVIGYYKIYKNEKEIYKTFIYNDNSINNQETIFYKLKQYIKR